MSALDKMQFVIVTDIDDDSAEHDCEADGCTHFKIGYAAGLEDGWIAGYMAVIGASLVAAEAAHESWLAARHG